MTKGVAASHAEHGQVWSKSVDERRRTRGRAAVMGNLDHPQRRRLNERQDVGFGGASDVAREHERDVLPPEFQDDRIVVPNILTLPVGYGRMQRRDAHVVQNCRISPLHRRPTDADSMGLGAEPCHGLEGRHGHAVPDVPRCEFA